LNTTFRFGGGSAGSPIVNGAGHLIAVENAFKSAEARKSANAAIESYGQRADYLREMVTDGALGNVDDERRYWSTQTERFKRSFDIVVPQILDRAKPNATATPILLSQEKFILVADDRFPQRKDGLEKTSRQQHRTIALRMGEPRVIIAHGEQTASLQLYLLVNGKNVAQDNGSSWYPHLSFTPSADGDAEIYIVGNDDNVVVTLLNYGWSMPAK
jgi:hypothetical protein